MSLLAELAQQLRYAADELDKAEQAAGKELFIALDLAQITEMARIIEESLGEDLPPAEIGAEDPGSLLN